MHFCGCICECVNALVVSIVFELTVIRGDLVFGGNNSLTKHKNALFWVYW